MTSCGNTASAFLPRGAYSKLGDSILRRVRKLFAKGLTLTAKVIAKEAGYSVSAVYQVKKAESAREPRMG